MNLILNHMQNMTIFQSSHFVFIIVSLHEFICNACMERPMGTRENIGYPTSGATVCWEPFCECWKLNSGSLQELQMLLTGNPSL